MELGLESGFSQVINQNNQIGLHLAGNDNSLDLGNGQWYHCLARGRPKGYFSLFFFKFFLHLKCFLFLFIFKITVKTPIMRP